MLAHLLFSRWVIKGLSRNLDEYDFNTIFAFDPKDETFPFFFGCTFRAKSRPLCPLDEAAPFSDVAPNHCPIVVRFFIQAHCPQFNQLFLTASTYSLCRQNASGSSIWKKSLNWLSYSELPAIERQLYDLKAWKQESLQQQKKDHDSQIIHFKRQLAIFMKILRYNPSGEIYGAENNLEALHWGCNTCNSQ